MDPDSLRLKSRFTRYLAALVLAIAAQAGSFLFVVPASMPLIVYAPFVVVSAAFGGLGPGLLTTILCVAEALYFFVIEPVGSFTLAHATGLELLGSLLATGVIASVFTEKLHRSAEQLAEAHRKTADILNSIQDGFTSLDRECRYTYVNEAAARMLGKTPQELLGRNLWEVWPLAADSPFGAAARRVVADNVRVDVEAFYGEPLNAWLEFRCYPLPDGMSLFFSDTTERRRVDERLRLLESAIMQTSDGVLIAKVDGKDLCSPEAVFANPAFERITGFSLADLEGGDLALLHGPRLNPHLVEREHLGCEAKCPADLEQIAYRKDGSEYWAEFIFRPLQQPDGSYTHCVWTCRDVTERKRAAEESRLLSSIVECSEDAIVGKNLDGIVLSWNQGAERIYGYSAEEMVGQSIARLVPPDHVDRFAEILEYLKLGKRIEHMETERVRKDGQRIFVALTISPLRDDGGMVVGAATIARDITDRVRAEEEVRELNQSLEKRVAERTVELQAANKELEAFAYSVSHDLRAPLRAVDGFSRILLEEYAPHLPAEAQHYLQVARENAVQMGKLIDALLAFSRLGRQALSWQRVAPRELVRQALADLAPEQEGRDVEVSIGDLPPCEGDPLLLKQVFFNLLSNALKYTRKRAPSRIQVSSFRFADLDRQADACKNNAPGGVGQNCLVYFVRDNGAGFDMRYADKLFGVFQRLHRAEEYEGTGVGLATVLRIVTRHGGLVWAEGASNQGATFYFTLPANGARNEPNSGAPEASAAPEERLAWPAAAATNEKG